VIFILPAALLYNVDFKLFLTPKLVTTKLFFMILEWTFLQCANIPVTDMDGISHDLIIVKCHTAQN